MSTYCTRSDIEATFGVQSVAKWATLQTGYTAEQITARITQAIAVASEDIDDVLRFAGYEIPCVNSSGTTPTTVLQLAADLAGVWLYESRGVDDVDASGNPRHRLQYHYERAQQKLQRIAARTIKINTLSNTG